MSKELVEVRAEIEQAERIETHLVSAQSLGDTKAYPELVKVRRDIFRLFQRYRKELKKYVKAVRKIDRAGRRLETRRLEARVREAPKPRQSEPRRLEAPKHGDGS